MRAVAKWTRIGKNSPKPERFPIISHTQNSDKTVTKMLTTLKGLVLRERSVGENDKFLDILTDSAGMIEVSAKGVKKQNSKNASVSQSFCYATFCVSDSHGRYILNSAEPIRTFFELSRDLERFSLANYFAEATMYVATEEKPNNEVLRLILNSLHFLSAKNRELLLLKAIFELRLMSEIGLVPNLIGCCECMKYTAPRMQFDLKGGRLFCEDCFGARDLHDVELLDDRLLHYIRFIALTDMQRLFNLSVSKDYLQQLSAITERYLELQLDRHFQTLDFFKTVNGYNYE